jgi:ferredoxin
MSSDSVQPVELKEAPTASEENGKVADFSSNAAGEPPVLASLDAEQSARDDVLRLLRRFHLGGPSEAVELETVGDDVLPALLAPFRDMSRIRYAFPLFLNPAEAETGELALPISDFLQGLVAEFAPTDEQARILKDNLARIERFVRGAIEGRTAPVDAAELLGEATKALPDELKVEGDNRSNLQADLDKMLAAVPRGGLLLGYGKHTTVHFFSHAVKHRLEARRRAFAFDAEQVVKKLRDVLLVEQGKSPEARAPGAVESAIGEAATQYIDPAALAATIQSTGGSEPIPDDRRERIENALTTLETFAKEKDKPFVVLVHDGSLDPSWLKADGDYELQEAVDPCMLASSVFDRKSVEYAEVFRAIRVAQLELAQSYDTQLHDPWFQNFNWEAFSKQELMLLPVVVAVESADRIAGAGMSSFSRLLRSGRPIHILAEIQPSGNPGIEAGEDPLASYRLELGYMGISHREAIIAQTSLARPQHLLEGFIQALDATRTSLHLLSTGAFDGDESPRLSPWLQAGAALEGRAHPFFRYNPELGHAWTECMDFTENPNPDVDWPHYSVAYQKGGPEGELGSTDTAFTFADFAVLDTRLREHFRLVPEGFERDELVPIDAYLELEPGDAFKHLPFIWVVDQKSALRRLVVSRELVLTCEDRLCYWRTLQAMAGTRNEYAEAAAASAREQALEEAAAEKSRLEAEHADKLAQAREETAGDVMQRLTEVLMGLDLTQALQAPAAVAAAPPATAETPTEVAAAPAEAAPAEPELEEDEVSFDEPWIDTMLCTSCNDCMKFNPLVFVYNENKQALIGDAKAGTFEQIVMAAEKCPARCIHPGKPLNPDEPNLDELIERAKPFN